MPGQYEGWSEGAIHRDRLIKASTTRDELHPIALRYGVMESVEPGGEYREAARRIARSYDWLR